MYSSAVRQARFAVRASLQTKTKTKYGTCSSIQGSALVSEPESASAGVSWSGRCQLDQAYCEHRTLSKQGIGPRMHGGIMP